MRLLSSSVCLICEFWTPAIRACRLAGCFLFGFPWRRGLPYFPKQHAQFDAIFTGGLGWLGLFDSGFGLVRHFGASASPPHPNGIRAFFLFSLAPFALEIAEGRFGDHSAASSFAPFY
jgi:hypothetical protein